MSNATGRSVLGQANVDKRRSAFEATKLSTSTEKADDDLESDFLHRLGEKKLFWYLEAISSNQVFIYGGRQQSTMVSTLASGPIFAGFNSKNSQNLIRGKNCQIC